MMLLVNNDACISVLSWSPLLLLNPGTVTCSATVASFIICSVELLLACTSIKPLANVATEPHPMWSGNSFKDAAVLGRFSASLISTRTGMMVACPNGGRVPGQKDHTTSPYMCEIG